LRILWVTKGLTTVSRIAPSSRFQKLGGTIRLSIQRLVAALPRHFTV
jgi:hypothetical protein